MFEPIKEAFGLYMGRFYNTQLSPTTHPMHEFVNRGVAKSIVWAPSSMFDAATKMLDLYQKNNTGAPTQPTKLPIIIIAISQSCTPTSASYTRELSDPTPIILPNDSKERIFKITTAASDILMQVVVITAEEPSSKSIAKQFDSYIKKFENRRFSANYRFAGVDTFSPIQLESNEAYADKIDSEVENIIILATNVTLKVQIPLFYAPKVGEPNDGKGTPGTDDPAGYPA